MISTGGNDKCVLVWDTDFGTGGEEGAAAEVEEDNNVEEEHEWEDTCTDYVERKTKKDKYGRPPAEEATQPVEEEAGGFFQVETVEAGDEFLAVKPWLGAIREPTGWKKPPLNQQKPPKVELALDYVHGYRAKYDLIMIGSFKLFRDCRNNLRYLKNGNIVYHAAGVGIVMDVATNTQR